MMGRDCNTCGGRRGACKVLVVKPEGKRPFLRHGHRWRIILKCIFMKWDGEGHGLD